MSPPPVVAVVGGGIAGLAAAYEVRRQRPDARVLVLEGAEQVGGKLRRSEVGGVVVDEGADAVLARVPHATELAREVGLGDRLVSPAAGQAYLWSRRRMRPLPT